MRKYNRIKSFWVYSLCEQHKVDLKFEFMNLLAIWESILGLF